MRLDRVHAIAFGPFVDETLELRPGLNVISGPNEAGKSSWLAAIMGGLGGLRRARGRRTKDEARFTELHQPWHGDDWIIELRLTTNDGRRFEVRQNLGDPTDSRISDLDTGRDVSSEFINDGAPDGALLLGLTRSTLPSTIFVRQADVLHVMSGADQLQEQLQSVTSTSAPDETAEAAIRRITAFRSENVGLLRANSTKPLQKAHLRTRDASEELDKAKEEHKEYLLLVDQLQSISKNVTKSEETLRTARAARRLQRFDEARHRVEGAREIGARLPPTPTKSVEPFEIEVVQQLLGAFRELPDEGEHSHAREPSVVEQELTALPDPPKGDTQPDQEISNARHHLALSVDAGQTARQELVSLANAALSNLKTRRERAAHLQTRLLDQEVDPAEVRELRNRAQGVLRQFQEDGSPPAELAGPSSSELKAQIDDLPPTPVGDLVPDERILDSFQELQRLEDRIVDHEVAKPQGEFDRPETLSVEPAELRRLADELDLPIPNLDTRAARELEEVETTFRSRSRLRAIAIAIGALILLAGIPFVLNESLVPGLALLGIGFVSLLATAGWSLKTVSPLLAERSRLQALELTHQTHRQSLEIRRKAARSKLESLELGARTSSEIRRIANQAEDRVGHKASFEAWSRTLDELSQQKSQNVTRLRGLLEQKVPSSAIPSEAGTRQIVEVYRQQCAERSRQAELAKRREVLEAERAKRVLEEKQHRALHDAHASVIEELLSVGQELGLNATSAPGLSDQIRSWLERSPEEERQATADRNSRAKLEDLLDGETIETLDLRIDQLQGLVAPEDLSHDHGSGMPRGVEAALREWRSASSTAESAERHLRSLLDGKLEVNPAESAAALFDQYVSECTQRKDLATQAGRRDDLERELETAKEIQAAKEARAGLSARLIEQAHALGAPETSTNGASNASAFLKQWLGDAQELQKRHAEEAKDRARLEALLGEATLVELESEIEQLEQDLEGLDREMIEAWGRDNQLDPAELETELNEKREKRDRLKGQISHMSESMPSVAEAEEELRLAEAEQKRVQDLDRVLESTLSFLEQARDSVQRNIAPRLASRVRTMLPQVTDGRYSEATVDPATLEVRVRLRTQPWRLADHLSQGTKEQIYLLLRVALADCLTGEAESPPLILDDVLVQSDSVRTIGLLELLHDLSSSQQVILFSQEDEVLAWASETLTNERDQVLRIERVATGVV